MEQLENKLSRCNTIREMLDEITEEYNCDFQISIFVKPIIIPMLLKAVSLLGLKSKNTIEIKP